MAEQKRKKIDYDMNAIYCIRILKEMNLIKSNQDNAKIYYLLTGKEVSASSIGRKINDFIISMSDDEKQQLNVNSFELYDYLNKISDILEKLYPKDDDKVLLPGRKNTPIDQLKNVFGITDDDLIKIFGVDLEKDKDEEIRQKVNRKIGQDPLFFVEYFGFDPSYFEVKKYEIGSWTVTVKEELKDGTKSPTQTINYNYRITIGPRKQPINVMSYSKYEEIIKGILKEKCLAPLDLFEHGDQIPHLRPRNNISIKRTDRLIVCPGLELHIGKLGSVTDFEDYSTKQAMWRLRFVAKQIIEYQRQKQAGQLLLGVGNDYFNSDNPADQTTAGTQQNNDSRLKEIIQWGNIGFIRLIETLKPYFDNIILKKHPGNHDETLSDELYGWLYFLYKVTKQDPKINIKLTHKAVRNMSGHVFGDYLIVLYHGKTGDSKPISDKKMVEEVKEYFPDETRKTKRTYIFAGHLHNDSVYSSGDVTVVRTAALVGVDSYHADNFYVSARQGHTVYLIDEKRGLISTEYLTLSDEDKLGKIEGMSRNPDADIHDEVIKALNLSTETIEQEIETDEVNRIDTIIKQINNMGDDVVNQILDAVGGSKLSTKKKLELVLSLTQIVQNAMGINQQITELEEDKKIIKEYKQPKIQEQVM